MEREEIVERLNKSFQNNTLNANEYFPLLTEFLEKKHPDKLDKMLQFVTSQPMFLGQTVQTVIDYFVEEYNICRLNKVVNNRIIPLCFLQ